MAQCNICFSWITYFILLFLCLCVWWRYSIAVTIFIRMCLFLDMPSHVILLVLCWQPENCSRMKRHAMVAFQSAGGNDSTKDGKEKKNEAPTTRWHWKWKRPNNQIDIIRRIAMCLCIYNTLIRITHVLLFCFSLFVFFRLASSVLSGWMNEP